VAHRDAGAVCGGGAGFSSADFKRARARAELPAGLHTAFGVEVPAFKLDWRRLYGAGGRTAAGVRTEIFARPDGQELKLDFYSPADRKDVLEKPRACIVVIHGGGWDSGDREQLASWNSRWVAKGYAVAAVSYRLAPKWIWPAQRAM